MPETKDIYPKPKEIVQDNLDYTLFSWSKQKGIDPIAVQRAEGVYLYDYDGKRYLDFSSGLMNVNIGHGHPRVTEAVVRQMQEVSYVTPGCVTRVRGELGRSWRRSRREICKRPCLRPTGRARSTMRSNWRGFIPGGIRSSRGTGLFMGRPMGRCRRAAIPASYRRMHSSRQISSTSKTPIVIVVPGGRKSRPVIGNVSSISNG